MKSKIEIIYISCTDTKQHSRKVHRPLENTSRFFSFIINKKKKTTENTSDKNFLIFESERWFRCPLENIDFLSLSEDAIIYVELE